MVYLSPIAGYSPNAGSIQPLTVVAGSDGLYSSSTTHALSHGQVVYGTVWCSNTAGLSIVGSTEGATVISEAPVSSEASVRFLITQTSLYERRTDNLTDTDQLHVVWYGFGDVASQLRYKVRLLKKGDQIVHDWTNVGQQTDLRFVNQSLADGECYLAEVQAVNSKEFHSAIVSTQACVESSPPRDTGEECRFLLSGDRLTIDWTSMFFPDETLWYEVCFGCIEGACDVLLPTETKQSFVSLNAKDRSLSVGNEIFGVITAVKPSGKSKTIKFAHIL